MQRQAVRLKDADTTVVAYGIGDQVDEDELQDIASLPYSENLIEVPGFNSLSDGEERLIQSYCSDDPDSQ